MQPAQVMNKLIDENMQVEREFCARVAEDWARFASARYETTQAQIAKAAALDVARVIRARAHTGT